MIVLRISFGPNMLKSLKVLYKTTSLAVFVWINGKWLFCIVGISIMPIVLEGGSRKMMAVPFAGGRISGELKCTVVIANGDISYARGLSLGSMPKSYPSDASGVNGDSRLG